MSLCWITSSTSSLTDFNSPHRTGAEKSDRKKSDGKSSDPIAPLALFWRTRSRQFGRDRARIDRRGLHSFIGNISINASIYRPCRGRAICRLAGIVTELSKINLTLITPKKSQSYSFVYVHFSSHETRHQSDAMGQPWLF